MVKVSVVVPVYNVEKYIEECLDSVLSQTLKEIEIICVNDGSTDSSLEILKRYKRKDGRIKIINKENKGYGNTINRGIECSTGEYISIIESDDFVEIDMLEKMYQAAEKHGVDAVKCNYYHYNGRDEYVEGLKGFPYDTPFSPSEYLDVYTLDASSNFLWNRRLFDEHNLKMNETAGASFQDISFQFQIWYNSDKVLFLKEALLHYRINNMGSSIHNPQKIFCVCDEFENIRRIIKHSSQNADEIMPYIVRNEYLTFKWNYVRLNEEYQYAFLLRWSETLLRNQEEGILNRSLFSNQEWDEIQAIIADRDCYFSKTAKIYFTRGINNKIVNYEIYKDALFNYMSQNTEVIIYGCGELGQKIANKLTNMYNVSIRCFVVSQKENAMVCGVPVVSIKDLRDKYSKDALIVVTVREKSQKDVIELINEQGYSKIIVIEEDIRRLI